MIRKIRAFVCNDVVSLLSGSHTEALEEEVARLRAENRALVNSILGVAGIPPVRVLEVGGSRLEAGKAKASEGVTSKKQNRDFQTRTACVPDEEKCALPLRRRSWQQIGRALEMEDALAARRERESDTEGFPAPRNIVLRNS